MKKKLGIYLKKYREIHSDICIIIQIEQNSRNFDIITGEKVGESIT